MDDEADDLFSFLRGHFRGDRLVELIGVVHRKRAKGRVRAGAIPSIDDVDVAQWSPYLVE